MKKYFLNIFLALVAPAAFSQTIKISGGLSSATSGEIRKLLYLDKPLWAGAGFIGIDYFEHRGYELSSEIGYMQLGGCTDDIMFIDERGRSYPLVSERINYLHANTTFRLKKSIRRMRFHVGAGPTIGYLLSHTAVVHNYYTPSFLKDNELSNVMFGLKPEAGFYYYVKERWLMGLNVSYNLGLFGLGDGGFSTLASRAALLQLTLGYRL
ncbi:MAG: hypothetical protein LBH04_01570 [Tannerellaceae bacterium]|nr:hypothetical protein [Tannerellaceae bacterium]